MVYQGRLTDTSGRSLTSVGSIRFAIYDALVDGNELWGETHTDVVLDDQGVFTVELGKDTLLPASIFSSGDVYLQLIVDDVPMDNRQLFGAAPFAYTMGSHGAGTGQVLKWNGTSWRPGSLAIEPGIAANSMATGISMVTTGMTDVVTVTMTTPAPGYICLEGRCNAVFSGTTGSNSVVYQIDETAGGSYKAPYTYVGADNYFGSGGAYFSLFTQRTYFKAAGTYTFRLEGQKLGLGNAKAEVAMLTARYYPTSYGDVTALAPSPGDHPEATAVTVENPDGSSSTVYKMDLRYYELEAQKARIRMLEAEKELEAARNRKANEQ